MKRAQNLISPILLAAVMLAFAAAFRPASAQDTGNTVIAGRTVGIHRIGESRTTLLQDAGKPENQYSLPGGIMADTWNGGDSRIFYRGGKVVQISIASLVVPLPGDITTSSTVAQVMARHPGLKKHEYTAHGSGGGILDYYDDQIHGIAFEFTQRMSQTSGESNTPKMYAVIVHKAGMPVIPDIGETQSDSR